MPVLCPDNPRRFGGHYYVKYLGEWTCIFCNCVSLSKTVTPAA